MMLTNRTRLRGRVKAAIVAAAVFTLAVASLVPAWAAAQEAAASAGDDIAPPRKNKNDVGIRGHGFVRDGDVFTTIDAPGAGF
jgi:hypothetical protein